MCNDKLFPLINKELKEFKDGVDTKSKTKKFNIELDKLLKSKYIEDTLVIRNKLENFLNLRTKFYFLYNPLDMGAYNSLNEKVEVAVDLLRTTSNKNEARELLELMEECSFDMIELISNIEADYENELVANKLLINNVLPVKEFANEKVFSQIKGYFNKADLKPYEIFVAYICSNIGNELNIQLSKAVSINKINVNDAPFEYLGEV
jgi:hypothetical protein